MTTTDYTLIEIDTTEPDPRSRFGRHLANLPTDTQPADDPTVDASWHYRLPEDYRA